jgi:hypothetical protein
VSAIPQFARRTSRHKMVARNHGVQHLIALHCASSENTKSVSRNVRFRPGLALLILQEIFC